MECLTRLLTNCFLHRYVSFNHGATTAQGRGDYVETPFGPDGQLIGERAQSDWLYVVPWGLRSILNWVNCRSASCLSCMPNKLIFTDYRRRMLPLSVALQAEGCVWQCVYTGTGPRRYR